MKRFHTAHGRHDLPWRATTNPYYILVSEVMLQQTQVPRVIPKYNAFIDQFPTTASLANAPLRDVLALWQGLGYNRRARMLQRAAQYIEKEHNGVFPRTKEMLQSLPGVGPYTAGAVAAFAFNEKVAMIETNIRTVFIHEFFATKEGVTDAEVLALVESCITRERNPRAWYAALMDYGTHLKQTIGNVNIKSKHYVKQSAFKGSLREVRGKILPLLLASPHTAAQLQTCIGTSRENVARALSGLQQDGLVVAHGTQWKLAT